MSYIQVDARGCGVGKTRTTIIPRIKQNIQDGIRTLVVVPSKTLQGEYFAHFESDEITVVNSDSGRVYEQYQTALTPVVCITHQGFLQTPHELFEKMNWDLIIDEALDPYASITFKTHDSAGRVWIGFDQITAWAQPEYVPSTKPQCNPQPYFELEFTQSTAPDIIDRQLWQKLSNPNYRKWSTWEIGENLMNNRAETCTIQFELDTRIFSDWTSVWIAGAAFDRTFMGYWLEGKYEIAHKFEPHHAPAHWHIPQEEFSWSKNFKAKNPHVEHAFRSYIDTHRNGRVIYNSNNDSTTIMPFGSRINHNAHGVNQYSHLTDYAFMSAIKPHPQFRNFIRERCGLDNTQLEFAFAGYTAYQLLMRSALRDPNNTTVVNLFFLDTQQSLSIMDLFDPTTYEVSHIETIQGNKTKPLTQAQRHKRWRLKQQQQKASKKG